MSRPKHENIPRCCRSRQNLAIRGLQNRWTDGPKFVVRFAMPKNKLSHPWWKKNFPHLWCGKDLSDWEKGSVFFFFEGGGWSVFEIPYEMMFPLPTTKVIYFIRIEPKWPIFWKLQPIKWFRPPSCQKGVICVPGISLPNSKLSAKRNERCWSLLVWFPSISRRFWPENQTTYPFFKGNASKNLVGKYSS